MTLIVEDGTGKADAESYCSVAFATTYHAARGNAAWGALATDALREQALRRATDFMVEVYRSQWAGTRLTVAQALDWPRYDVPMRDAPGGYGSWPAFYPQDDVPVAVQRACAELALRAASVPLAPDVGAQVTEKKVGPIEIKYAEGTRQSTFFRAADLLLRPFLINGGGSMIPVVRA
ncbi:hypothetical protein J7E49_06840 [Variovorax paradoxus]|nr:hypothetical protein [Variovorax paradoxus]